jgi:hypothetical protein
MSIRTEIAGIDPALHAAAAALNVYGFRAESRAGRLCTV